MHCWIWIVPSTVFGITQSLQYCCNNQFNETHSKFILHCLKSCKLWCLVHACSLQSTQFLLELCMRPKQLLVSMQLCQGPIETVYTMATECLCLIRTRFAIFPSACMIAKGVSVDDGVPHVIRLTSGRASASGDLSCVQLDSNGLG